MVAANDIICDSSVDSQYAFIQMVAFCFMAALFCNIGNLIKRLHSDDRVLLHGGVVLQYR
jgi:hypothetical protein